MKELVEKVAALYAEFEKMQKLRWRTETRLLVHVHAKLLWKLKKQ